MVSSFNGLWNTFLEYCLPDEEDRRQVQRDVAEAIMCKQSYLPVWYGPFGGPGESKIIASDILLKVLGSYARREWIDSFARNRRRPRKELAADIVQEARLVFVRNTRHDYRRFVQELFEIKPRTCGLIVLEETDETFPPADEAQYVRCVKWPTLESGLFSRWSESELTDDDARSVLKWIVAGICEYCSKL